MPFHNAQEQNVWIPPIANVRDGRSIRLLRNTSDYATPNDVIRQKQLVFLSDQGAAFHRRIFQEACLKVARRQWCLIVVGNPSPSAHQLNLLSVQDHIRKGHGCVMFCREKIRTEPTRTLVICPDVDSGDMHFEWIIHSLFSSGNLTKSRFLTRDKRRNAK